MVSSGLSSDRIVKLFLELRDACSSFVVKTKNQDCLLSDIIVVLCQAAHAPHAMECFPRICHICSRFYIHFKILVVHLQGGSRRGIDLRLKVNNSPIFKAASHVSRRYPLSLDTLYMMRMAVKLLWKHL